MHINRGLEIQPRRLGGRCAPGEDLHVLHMNTIVIVDAALKDTRHIPSPRVPVAVPTLHGPFKHGCRDVEELFPVPVRLGVHCTCTMSRGLDPVKTARKST